MKILLLFLCVFYIKLVSAQQQSSESYIEYDDERLLELFHENVHDSIVAASYAYAYHNRGKKRGDTIMMARAYDRLARAHSPETNLKYADSIIYIMGDKKHKVFPAIAYVQRSYAYSDLGDFKKSTEELYNGLNAASKSEYLSLQVFILDQLIITKSYYGDGEGALKFLNLRDSLSDISYNSKNINKETRLSYKLSKNTIRKEEKMRECLVKYVCNINLKRYDSAYNYYRIFKNNFSKYNGQSKKKFNFLLSQMGLQISYYKDDYINALEYSNKILIDSINNTDGSIFDAHLYKGLSYIGLGKEKRAFSHFKKADSIFSYDLEINSYRRQLYNNIYKLYLKNGNIEMQIVYLNKLIKMDSVLKERYIYFEPSLSKNFSTPKLVAAKNELIAQLDEKNKRANFLKYGLILALTATIVVGFIYFSRQKVYKKRYLKLIQHQDDRKNVISIVKNKNKASVLSTEIINDIAERLTRFESNKKFLHQDITLHSLSKSLRTNPNYLSRIINLKMDKNFSQYLNDLRISYAIEEIKENAVFRKYTIKAIATECGFKNATSFSRAFYKNTGLYPSYFIDKQEKEVG